MPEFKLYARKEPTDDREFLNHRTPKQPMEYDVVLYKDAGATQFYCRCPWHYSTTPDRRTKYKNINSVRWSLQWLPDLKETK